MGVPWGDWAQLSLPWVCVWTSPILTTALGWAWHLQQPGVGAVLSPTAAPHEYPVLSPLGEDLLSLLKPSTGTIIFKLSLAHFGLTQLCTPEGCSSPTPLTARREEEEGIFHLEGPYKDDLIQLPDHLRAGWKLKHLVQDIIQMLFKQMIIKEKKKGEKRAKN